MKKPSKYWPAWLSWLEHCPIKQKLTSSVPDQGTYLGCGFGPWLESMRGNQLMILSLPLSDPSPLSKFSKHVLG